MHEMSLAEGVLQIVEDSARREHFGAVRVVRLEIGELAGVEVDKARGTWIDPDLATVSFADSIDMKRKVEGVKFRFRGYDDVVESRSAYAAKVHEDAFDEGSGPVTIRYRANGTVRPHRFVARLDACVEHHQIGEVPKTECAVNELTGARIAHRHPLMPGADARRPPRLPGSLTCRIMVAGTARPGIVGDFVVIPDHDERMTGMAGLQ